MAEPAASSGAVAGVLEAETPLRVVPAASKIPLWQIHELPVPIRTFPLPSFYPSNPLSLIHVAYAWISQLLSPPREPSVVHEGIWSPKTRSVHIRDPKSIRALWEQGFYGKGHLSRSEPNWLKREQAKIGAHADHVAELFTVSRREERKQMKWDRARKEQEAIERTRRDEAWVAPVGPQQLLNLPNSQRELNARLALGHTDGSSSSTLVMREDSLPSSSASVSRSEAASDSTQPSKATSPSRSPVEGGGQPEAVRRKSVRFSPKVESTTFQHSDPPSPNHCVPEEPGFFSILHPAASPSAQDKEQGPPVEAKSRKDIVDKEHLQLTLEETFWLSFGLGVLQVKDERTGAALSVERLFELCRQQSYFPPRTNGLQADDPFLVHYAVYHHFRSLGWVTRPGIKFGCDWLLYHRGPAFSHAEFAIIVIPSYTDPYWETCGRKHVGKSWHWLHLVNRVQSTAFKTLVLVYVDIPAPAENNLSIVETLRRYKIKEIMVKRWLINRNRD
ncbi:hypothetical protein BX600DRAFT_381141 [Xylariales sp. PMI_506]|nr:hypothetical protein BX600DRAFT_381141 [Xylariales sp. PMI_506]